MYPSKYNKLQKVTSMFFYWWLATIALVGGTWWELRDNRQEGELGWEKKDYMVTELIRSNKTTALLYFIFFNLVKLRRFDDFVLKKKKLNKTRVKRRI